MILIKELPIFIVGRGEINSQKEQVENKNIGGQNKFRFSLENNKNQGPYKYTRLSHKTILDQPRINGKLKRRISTAGTNKRFPKDFFKLDDFADSQKKSPNFALRLNKNLYEPLSKKKIISKLDQQEYLKVEESESQKTPKFHEPQKQNKESENQFLDMGTVNKIISPFLSIDFPKNQDRQIHPNYRKPLNFMKKVKKGECLHVRIESNRSCSQNAEKSLNFPHLRKMESSKP